MYQKFVQLRSRLLVFLTNHLALPALRILRRPEKFPYTQVQLRVLSEGSLGKDLIDMLDANNLHLLPHYAKHDMKHLLLDYKTNDEGEVYLQFFMLGNGHISFPVLSTTLFGIFTMPEYWKSFLAAFSRGKNSRRLHNWDWFAIVKMRTSTLKNLINNTANSY